MSGVETNDAVVYIDEKRNALIEDNELIGDRISNTPEGVTDDFSVQSLTDTLLEKFNDSPLAQLGKDFLAEQGSKIGHQLLNNAKGIVGDKLEKVASAAEKAVDLAFTTLTTALTAKNDIILIMLQEVAEHILEALDDKEVTRAQMIESLRQLHNALAQLVAGDPFFSKYLAQLRQALLLLFQAEKELTLLTNNYIATDIFQEKKLDSAIKKLEDAEKLLAPQGQQTDKPFTSSGLFANIGIPSEPQQLSIILAIPKLAKEVILATKGYFLHVAKINGLLVAFNEGLQVIQATSSAKLKQYATGILLASIDNLQSLNSKMALSINGGEFNFIAPAPGFQPKPIQVSTASVGWVLEIDVIITQLRFLPRNALKNINLNKASVSKYEKAVAQIKALTDRKKGPAVVFISEGQEQIGLIEQQITKFTLAALGAIVSNKIASNILPLGRTVISYLELSRENDQAIRQALIPFINDRPPLFDNLKKITKSIHGLLDKLGLDKAADLLRSGRFKEFFNINARTATYAGYALSIISELKSCARTTESVDKLDEAEREFNRDKTVKELYLRRSASPSLERQRDANQAEIDRLEKLKQDIKGSPKQCVLDEKGNFNGDAMMQRFGSVLGVNLLADSFGSDKLKNLAKGKLF